MGRRSTRARPRGARRRRAAARRRRARTAGLRAAPRAARSRAPGGERVSRGQAGGSVNAPRWGERRLWRATWGVPANLNRFVPRAVLLSFPRIVPENLNRVGLAKGLLRFPACQSSTGYVG